MAGEGNPLCGCCCLIPCSGTSGGGQTGAPRRIRGVWTFPPQSLPGAHPCPVTYDGDVMSPTFNTLQQNDVTIASEFAWLDGTEWFADLTDLGALGLGWSLRGGDTYPGNVVAAGCCGGEFQVLIPCAMNLIRGYFLSVLADPDDCSCFSDGLNGVVIPDGVYWNVVNYTCDGDPDPPHCSCEFASGDRLTASYGFPQRLDAGLGGPDDYPNSAGPPVRGEVVCDGGGFVSTHFDVPFWLFQAGDSLLADPAGLQKVYARLTLTPAA